MILAALLLCLFDTPNVVIVIADDIARSDVALIDTPELDAFADQGITFSRAYSHPVCSPTRIGLTFGEWSGDLVTSMGNGGEASCTEIADVIPLSKPSLPDIMETLGYETALFGKWHVGGNDIGPWEITPNLYGYSLWASGSQAGMTACEGTSYMNWVRVDDGVSYLSSEYSTEAIRDAFLSWWLTPTSTPRFAVVSFNIPHTPLHVPPASVLHDPPPTGPQTRRQKYELMVDSFDFVLGQILDNVSLRDTFVFVVGDNGTPTRAIRFDQDEDRVKKSTFEDGIGVPMLVAGPGIKRGCTDAVVHVVDLFATVIGIGGGAALVPQDTDSIDLALLLAGKDVEVREYSYSERKNLPDWDRAIVTSDYKLRNVLGQGEELYHLGDETNSLDLNDPALADTLAQMRAWMMDP